MKIILAVDGSKHALDAVRYLTTSMGWVKERPQVELLFVHPPVPKLSGLGMVVGKKQLDRYYHDEGMDALAAAKQLLDAAKVAYEPHILVGQPAETIVAHAKKTKADLLLIGHRGVSAAASMVIGSVASKLLQLSPIPVLLVK